MLHFILRAKSNLQKVYSMVTQAQQHKSSFLKNEAESKAPTNNIVTTQIFKIYHNNIVLVFLSASTLDIEYYSNIIINKLTHQS